MMRLFHIVVLILALLGLTAPGWAADTAISRCSRGAIWTQSQSVVGLPAPVELSVLLAPTQISVCAEQAIVAETTVTITPARGTVTMASVMLAPPGALAEAELPPPRAL